jgi:hypothetical protein
VSFKNPGDGKRCDHCDQPGKPYTYRGKRFSGLHAYRSERLCQGCLDLAATADLADPRALTPAESAMVTALMANDAGRRRC